ncbi:AbrB/MazE/SpoVT family DNA-binding domain-containing protein [bacterium]|nr:AbrB/MazE/SpoVT family DNA-binding domain-containing protein [bacterium]
MAVLKTNLVKIGNSQGIRIPKAVLRQIKFVDEIEMEIKKDCLVLKPASNLRAGWAEAFHKANAKEKVHDSELDVRDPELDAWESLPNENDEEEWTWK